MTQKQEIITGVSLTDEEQQLPTKNFFSQEHIKTRFIEAYQNNESAQKAISVITMECFKNPKLAACTKVSLLQAGLDAANFGLIPNKLAGHAYLIPFKNYKTKLEEAQLIIGYKGYLKKFEEDGWTVEVELVSKEEVEQGRFEEIRGTTSQIIHKPLRTVILKEDNIALGYAIAKKEGKLPVSIVMGLGEIIETAKTKIWNDDTKKMCFGLKGVWVDGDRTTDFGQMCKKTLIRRLASVCPVATVSILSSYEGERDKEESAPIVKTNTDPVAERMNQEKAAITSEAKEAEVLKTEPEEKLETHKNENSITTDELGLKVNKDGVVVSMTATEAQKRMDLRPETLKGKRPEVYDAEFVGKETTPEPTNPLPEDLSGFVANYKLVINRQPLKVSYATLSELINTLKTFLRVSKFAAGREMVLKDNAPLMEFLEKTGETQIINELLEITKKGATC